jgi:hypothetical protein
VATSSGTIGEAPFPLTFVIVRPVMLRIALALSALIAATEVAGAQGTRPAGPGQPTAKRVSAEPGAAIQPGTYDLEIIYGGGALDGTLELIPAGDTLGAKLQVGDHASPITSVVRKGSRLMLRGGDEGMRLVYDLQFAGDSVSGTFTLNGEGGTVAGKRRK